MSDRGTPVLRYIIIFIACYGSYKAINIIDACVRTYLVRKYHVSVDDCPAVAIERFFADEDWD